MKLQNCLTGITLIASTAIAFSTSPAQAFNFTTGTNLGACGVLVDNLTIPLFKAFIDDTTTVSTCKTADGFTLSASQPSDGFLQGKMVDKDKVVKGIGISIPTPGPVPGEIQPGETLTATLDTASIIKSIDLSFLYLKGEFADKVNEIAEITALGAAGSLTGTLSVTGATTAVWSLGGTVINLDPSVELEGGAYSILNPFGNFVVSSLLFTAPDNAKIKDPFDNDYSLVAIEAAGPGITEDVPEPATMLGLTLVGGVLATARRRRNSSR
jgi:hypothetical protein